MTDESAREREVSGLAIASLAYALVSIWVPVVFTIVALVVANRAEQQIYASDGELSGLQLVDASRRIAKTWLAFVLVVVILVVASALLLLIGLNRSFENLSGSPSTARPTERTQPVADGASASAPCTWEALKPALDAYKPQPSWVPLATGPPDDMNCDNRYASAAWGGDVNGAPGAWFKSVDGRWLMLGDGDPSSLGVPADEVVALCQWIGCRGVETRPVTVSGDALPALENPDADTAVGLHAPVLGGETFDGKKITIGDSGKSTLVVFVAHWCPHCQREVPFLKSYFDLHGLPEGVDVLAVSTSINADRPNYPPSKWLDREGWEIPTMVDADDSGAATAWGLSAFPYFVALRADGTVAARVTGELEAPQLEALFAAAKG